MYQDLVLGYQQGVSTVSRAGKARAHTLTSSPGIVPKGLSLNPSASLRPSCVPHSPGCVVAAISRNSLLLGPYARREASTGLGVVGFDECYGLRSRQFATPFATLPEYLPSEVMSSDMLPCTPTTLSAHPQWSSGTRQCLTATGLRLVWLSSLRVPMFLTSGSFPQGVHTRTFSAVSLPQ